MIKLYINGYFLSQEVTGVQRFATSIVDEIDRIAENDKEISVCILCKPGTSIPHYKNIKAKICGNKKGYAWVMIDLPEFVRKHKGELLTLSGLCPVSMPGFFTVHDLSVKRVKEAYSLKFRTVYNLVYALCIPRAKKIFTVSSFSKRDIVKTYGLSDNDVSVVYNAAVSPLKFENTEKVLKKYGLKPKGYYFCVGTKSIHKNQQYLERCASLCPDDIFVISGGTSGSFAKREGKVPRNVKFTGYITDSELAVLYKNSKCFVFPSFFEGFGIPPLEAIMSGADTVAVSDIKVMKEIYKRGVNFFDPYDVFSFIKGKDSFVKIEESDVSYYRNTYSWNKSAQMIIDEIKRSTSAR